MFSIVDPNQRVIVVVDGRRIELTVIKEKESGLVFAVDASYFEQGVNPVVSPYGHGTGVDTSGMDDGSATAHDVLMETHGGCWGEHPDHPIEDWKYQVENGDTRLGYWAWVESKMREVASETTADETPN